MPNDELLVEASRVLDHIIELFLDGDTRAVVGQAGAGAGKTGVVTAAGGAAADAGLQTGITAPTNEQVWDLVRRFTSDFPNADVALLHATSAAAQPPDDVLSTVGIATTTAADARNHQVIIATNDKFAYSRDDLGTLDRLVLDEAYQSDSIRYQCVAGLANVHLLLGDAGQLKPWSPEDLTRWRGLPVDPLLTAVGVLLTNHPDVEVVTLPLTRRLPPSAVPVVQPAFYGPELVFGAATLPDEREMTLDVARLGHRGRPSVADAAIEHAADHGWAHVLLRPSQTLSTDGEIVETITTIVQRLMERGARLRDERVPQRRGLAADRVAVAVSHRDQRSALRVELDRAGLAGVHVDTANKLQGLEFDVVVAWHPLAGLVDVDDFHLDPGRACVMLTRHRHACIVVGRASDLDIVRFQPPTTPAYLGSHPDPILDGWQAHRAVFEELAVHAIEA